MNSREMLASYLSFAMMCYLPLFCSSSELWKYEEMLFTTLIASQICNMILSTEWILDISYIFLMTLCVTIGTQHVNSDHPLLGNTSTLSIMVVSTPQAHMILLLQHQIVVICHEGTVIIYFFYVSIMANRIIYLKNIRNSLISSTLHNWLFCLLHQLL